MVVRIIIFALLIGIVFFLVTRERLEELEPEKVQQLQETHEVVVIKEKKEYIIINLPAEKTASRQQLIPRTIMQTNERVSVPPRMALAIKNIQDMNPEYEYLYFDDKESEKFISKHFGIRHLKAYKKLIPGAYKADFFRYCFLYVKGGIYIDTGMEMKVPFRDFIKATDTFVSPEDNISSGVYNAFMASTPNHPIIEEAIQQCLLNIENDKYSKSPLHITGPRLLSQAFEDVVGFEAIPNAEYEGGVRIIQFWANETLKQRYKYEDNFDFECGGIWSNNICVAHTKYKGYKEEVKGYNSKAHYSQLWWTGGVYSS